MFKRLIDFWASLWKPLPLRSGVSARPEGERRDLERHERSLEVTCRPLHGLGPPPSWPAVVQDVSVGGLGLLLPREVAPDTMLEVVWPKRIAGLPPATPVRVARATAQPGGNWALGCAFTVDLSEVQLQALLAAMR